ncbi:ribose-phosphate diphosphokinase [Egicoccus sp. AB-alg2]|uniref:ribose-phosphate diphosphokinase n=1 Tax=Egicoccus sp. AB-alg2 TaxID=3242693 RepID=UPI00359D847A
MAEPLDIVLLAGSANRRLAGAIADYLDHPLEEGEALRFSEGNTFVRVPVSVRERDVVLVQGTGPPANDNFMELLFWIDALKRASARTVTVVMPYFSYAKGDKKDEPRVSIRARVCADAIEAAGADRVVTMDLHAPQVQGFFRIPVDDLYAMPVLCDRVAARRTGGLVVVSPDAGFAKKARLYATRLGAPLAIADKQRIDHTETAEVLDLIGDVAGRHALIVDDFTVSGGTLIEAARLLHERGAASVSAAVTHSLLRGAALRRLGDSHIGELFVTDTIDRGADDDLPKITVVSVAALFGEAIRRIAMRESVSVLFE